MSSLRDAEAMVVSVDPEPQPREAAVTAMTDIAIRPFEVHVPDDDLADLQRRIAATRWPPEELVADRSQGVQLATIQHLVAHWGTGYDWRRCEAQLNALPPCSAGLVSGSMIFSCSITEPGQPWLTISGSASSCGDLTWMK